MEQLTPTVDQIRDHLIGPGVQTDIEARRAEGCNNQDPREAFDALVRRLELRSYSRLNEPARSRCRLAYTMWPTAVAAAVEYAIEHAERNSIGYFCRLVERGVHLELVAAPAELPPAWRLRVIHDVDGRDEVLVEDHPDEPTCERRAAELRGRLHVFEVEVLQVRQAA
jgi:hypothetical protein